jgi:hypothetical protein
LLNDDHCGLPVNELSTLAEKLLEVPAVLIETAMALELAEKTIVKDGVEGTEWVFLAGSGRLWKKLSKASGPQQTGYPASNPKVGPGSFCLIATILSIR